MNKQTPIEELINDVGNMAQGLDADELYDYFMKRTNELLLKEKDHQDKYKQMEESLRDLYSTLSHGQKITVQQHDNIQELIDWENI